MLNPHTEKKSFNPCLLFLLFYQIRCTITKGCFIPNNLDHGHSIAILYCFIPSTPTIHHGFNIFTVLGKLIQFCCPMESIYWEKEERQKIGCQLW